ncbi:MAG: beta-N-acetylhexosaminidase [Williamsia sp.]|nr:beta-N-acetylhexosaminidase [Williamsia sp.]
MKLLQSPFKKTLCIAALAAISCFASAQVSIFPKPVETTMPQTAGTLVINSKTLISADAALKNSGQFFSDYLKKYYGFGVSMGKKTGSAPAIDISVDKSKVTHTDGYTLLIDKGGVHISGNSPAGAFYGIQSLIQLLPVPDSASLASGRKPAADAGVSVPYISINDYPRFAYRGMHLDVGRHFFTIPEVKKYIDYIALHKMNRFHWHLTEDQGWRIEIKKYPKLTQVGAYRNGTIIGHFPGTGNDNTRSGGFYTQQQVKEIVAYAADRYITVVPEIEMPGHASAAIAAYPELSCFPNENTKRPRGTVWSGDTTGKQVQQTWGVFPDVFCPSEKTFSFLQDVLDEILPLFPSKYIHIGGDECPKDNWKRSEFCQQLIKEKGLKDEHGLQSYFIQRIEKYLNSKGRSIIGWDEILEGGLAPNATVMSWRGEQGGIAAAKENHDVIMTPSSYAYLDYSQSRVEDSLTIGGFLPLQKVYSYNPVPPALAGEPEKHVLGAQGNLWTEYIASMRKLEYQLFPRMTALSEAVWSPASKDWDNFQDRLRTQFLRYQLWGASASRAVYDPRSNGPAPQRQGGTQ